MRPHRWQPIRLPHPWDSPGKNTGVGCHFLLQCMKMKSLSEVAQLCPTLSDPMDCSLPGSSIHGIFQARVLEWVAIAFSAVVPYMGANGTLLSIFHIIIQFPYPSSKPNWRIFITQQPNNHSISSPVPGIPGIPHICSKSAASCPPFSDYPSTSHSPGAE